MIDAKLLSNAKKVLEEKKVEIRDRLLGVGGQVNLLLPEDRKTYSSCVELVPLISRLELLKAIGATDDLESAELELQGALNRSGLATGPS
jgi:hypothetical protein